MQHNEHSLIHYMDVCCLGSSLRKTPCSIVIASAGQHMHFAKQQAIQLGQLKAAGSLAGLAIGSADSKHTTKSFQYIQLREISVHAKTSCHASLPATACS